MGTRLPVQRGVALLAVGVVGSASVVTGWRWPVAVDHGGDTAGNPISRYGPHWLYPTLATVVLAILLVLLLRTTGRPTSVIGLTAFTAGAVANLSQWLLLGGVSNPVPAIRGSGHLSIGDLCLWVGVLTLAVPLLRRRRHHPSAEPTPL